MPDDVTEIRSESGDVITPVSGVWWAVIDTGDRVTFTIVAADGRTMETTLG